MAIREIEILFENFKRFTSKSISLKPQERNRIRQQIMQELTEKNYEKIKTWMNSAEGSDLSFDKMFKGKKRVVVPFFEAGQDATTMLNLIDFFKENGWTVDLSTGTAAKTKETVIPAGPRAGEKVKKTHKERVGKIFQTVAAFDDTKGGPQYEYLLGVLKKLLPNFNPKKSKEIAKVLNYDEFWSSKAEFFRKNPDAINRSSSQYSIVVSRHPIDVLRMSDFADIQSCHSEGSGYFQCAMAESKGHGPIAYLVDTDDLKNVNLDDEEIFEDPARRIRGIRPIARLRLRKYAHEDGDWELAMPEQRVYGLRHPGFQEAVLKWARENQEFDYQDVLADYGNEKIKKYGGSYGDTLDHRIFNNFFEGPYEFVAGGYIDYVVDGEDEFLFDQYEEQCNEIMVQARENLEHADVAYDIIDVDGQPQVVMYGEMYFDLSDELEGVEIDNREVYAFIKQAADDNGIYLPHPQWGDWTENDLRYRDLDAVVAARDPGVVGDDPPNFVLYMEGGVATLRLREVHAEPDGFANFVFYMEGIDRDYDKIMKSLRELLEDDGYISPHLSSEQELASLSNFAAKVNGDEFLIVTKNPIVLDNKIDKWKKIDKKILAAFKKEFEQRVEKAVLKSFLERVSLKQNWDEKTEGDSEPTETRYSLSFDLKGVTFNFLERYEVTSKKNIKPMVAYFKAIDDNYSILNGIVKQTYAGMLDKYKEEIAGQLRLPIDFKLKSKEDAQVDDIMNLLGISETKKGSCQKLFENWRSWLDKQS